MCLSIFRHRRAEGKGSHLLIADDDDDDDMQQRLIPSSGELEGTDVTTEPQEFPLGLEIICATGLRNADFWGKSDPYCTCEISGKPASKVRTETVENNLDPIWNFDVEIDGYTPGDDLVFHVFDEDWGKADDLLGSVVLPNAAFHPSGLERELELSDSGTGVPAFLRVRISPAPSELVRGVPEKKHFSGLWRPFSQPNNVQSDSNAVESDLVADQPLKLKVIGGHRLPNSDWGGLSDPYCVVEIPGKLGSRRKTRTINDNLDPVWDESFEITEHAPGDPLVFAVWDEDWGKTHDLLGFVTITYSDYHPNGFQGELPLSMHKKSRKGVLEGLWQAKDSRRALIKRKSVVWSDGSISSLAPRGRNQICVKQGEQVLSAYLSDGKLIWDNEDVWTRAQATISILIEPATVKLASKTGLGIRKHLFGIDQCQLNNGSITGLGIRNKLAQPINHVKARWADKKRDAQRAVIKMSKPYRDKVMMATRDALKCSLTADPDMWRGLRRWIHKLVDDLWHDITEEVEASIFEATRGVEGHQTHNVQSLSEKGVRPTWLSPLWFRAYILYHFLPFDKSPFGCLRDPAFLICTLMSLIPGLRVMFFLVLLILLTCPGPPDEFQLVQYIMMFKGTQFLSSGVLMAIYGGILYYECVHRNGRHTCHSTGPGASQSSWLVIVDIVGCSLLVWLGFFFLPMTQKAAGLKALTISPHGSADAEEGVDITDDATHVINAAAKALKASNVGPTRTLMASSFDGNRVELKTEDDGSGRHKWLIAPISEGCHQIQLLGGVRGGRILTANNRQLSLNFQDGSDGQRWVLTKVDGNDNLYHIRTPALPNQPQAFLGVHQRSGRYLGLHPMDDGTGCQRWWIPGLDADTPKQVWTVCGKRCYPGRGGRLRNLLLYDVYCFLACAGLLVIVILCEIHAEIKMDATGPLCAPNNASHANKDEVLELLKKTKLETMHFKAALYWARVTYALLAIPFFFFNIPVLQAILTHTTATGYNQRGVVVAYLLPPCPEEVPPSAAELVQDDDVDDASP